ncbi:adenosylcobinamide-phosphate synthase CbiB [Jeotgalibacillus proteolyticus]|uniref:Cobalamin biosynthesis protein CobD n=1 Tax=Jeotgalibacillus proteolyticus TaxID=2082395 RepID=A0A2S5G9R4_9BACL|nr:adenosylcobinamide-phosphate synthase CbiB [Jeotgalibacillus proteolyticus]PPA69665.1 cobalamin biosynthesis protein CobD [Jeotgalibacillus proteolyticus]
MLTHLLAATIALLLDRLIGDPPHWPHPVRWIGAFSLFLEKRFNKGSNRKAMGVLHLLIILCAVGLIAFGIMWAGYSLHWAAGFSLEVLFMTSALAKKSLQEAAREVLIPLEKGNLIDARMKLSWIVGRDTEDLDEAEITRGTVETIAENTSDGITAPLFWAIILGAPGIWLYKAINTCDSMVGYRNERFEYYGFASAKMDDFVNWVPSRITGLLMLFTRKPEAAAKRMTLIRMLPSESKKHPSPNSGWGEAAVALLLSIQLGGRNTYKGVPSFRPKIGHGRLKVNKLHIDQTLSIMNRTVLLFIVLFWIGGGIIYGITAAWS